MCVRGLLHLETPALYDGCAWGKRVWQRFAEKCAIWATWVQFSITGSDSVYLGGLSRPCGRATPPHPRAQRAIDGPPGRECGAPGLDHGVADRLRQLSPSMAMISDLDDSIDQCDRRCRVGENSRPV